MFYLIKHTEPWMTGALQSRNWFDIVSIRNTREEAEEALVALQALPGTTRYSIAEAV